MKTKVEITLYLAHPGLNHALLHYLADADLGTAAANVRMLSGDSLCAILVAMAKGAGAQARAQQPSYLLALTDAQRIALANALGFASRYFTAEDEAIFNAVEDVRHQLTRAIHHVTPSPAYR